VYPTWPGDRHPFQTASERLQKLEQELGSVIVAYQADSPFAPLSEDQLQRLKALEQELGVVLLAFKAPAS